MTKRKIIAIDILRNIAWIKKYSKLKFLIYATKNTIYSGLAYLVCFVPKKNEFITSCDVLMLCRSKNSYSYKNISKIFESGLNLFVIVQDKPKQILLLRLLSKPKCKNSYLLYIYFAYSRYLLEKYSPKVVITEDNGSILSTVLKMECSKSNVKTVHLAHSVTTNNYRMFSLVDYDYYFLFGLSSINYLKSRTKLFGEANCVVTGSWQIQDRLEQPLYQTFPEDNDLFLLIGSGPGFEEMEVTTYYYSLVIDLVKERKNSQLLFKPHPRSDLVLWKRLTEDLDSSKFAVIDRLSMNLHTVKMAFCGYTNAILDVSKIGIVPVLMAISKSEDLFEYQRFFGCPVSNKYQLLNKIKHILDNYPDYKSITDKFATYHLSSIKNPKAMIFNIVSAIVIGEDIRTDENMIVKINN